MTTDLQIPSSRPLPPGRLDARRSHLLAEIRRVPHQPSRRVWLPAWSPLPLAAGLAALAAAVLVTVLALQEFGANERGGKETIRVVVAPSGPVPAWNGTFLTGPCLGLSFLDEDCGKVGGSGAFSIDMPRELGNRAKENLELVGGTPAERRLLLQIVERLPGTALTRVEIVPATAGGDRVVTLRFAAAGGDGLRNDWEEMLVAGAYRDLARDEGLRPVVGFPPPSPVAVPAPDARAQVQARLRAAASAASAAIDELTISEPDGLAVLVVLRVPDPGPFLKHRLPAILEALGDRWRDYDGTFVEVVDEEGAFVWAAGTVPRTSHGSVGTRAGLEGCSPVANWGPTPPPCPTG